MAAGDKLVELIEKVVTHTGNDGFICGVVKAVNKKALTCDVALDEGLVLSDCRLGAVEMQETFNHITAFPKVGSYVCGVATADLRDVLIVSISEVESVEIKAPIIKINDFKTQLDKMSARIDGIINAIKNGKPNTQTFDSGTALQQTIIALLPTYKDKENFNTLADYEGN